jgi:hypothetical protein
MAIWLDMTGASAYLDTPRLRQFTLSWQLYAHVSHFSHLVP